MIKRLQHSDIEVAKQIRAVFQVSYAVEAKLLGATDFPPLKRPLERYVDTTTTFFGLFKEHELAAATMVIPTSTASLLTRSTLDKALQPS